jgi:hypothetical protein
MNTLPKPLAARLQALQGVLADPKFKDAVLKASNGLLTPNRSTPWSLPLSQDPARSNEPIQADTSNKPIVQNEAHNVSGTNLPGEQMPPDTAGGPGGSLSKHLPPGHWSGAVPDTKNSEHPENRNPGPEGFQGRPGGEQETGILVKNSKELAPNSRPAERNIAGQQPIDRNVPLTDDGMPLNRFGKAAPRKSVYLASPK